MVNNQQVPDMWKWFTDEGGFVDKLYEEDWSSSSTSSSTSSSSTSSSASLSSINLARKYGHHFKIYILMFHRHHHHIHVYVKLITMLVRYNSGEMNFLCPGVKAEDCVIDSRGRNSCDGPCKQQYRIKRNLLDLCVSLNLCQFQAREVQMTPTCFTRTSFLEHQDSGWILLTTNQNSFLCRMLRVRNDSCEIHEKFHGAIQVPLKTCSFLKLMIRVMVMNLVMPIIVVMVKTMEIVETQLPGAGKGARQTETQFQKCRLKL